MRVTRIGSNSPQLGSLRELSSLRSRGRRWRLWLIALLLLALLLPVVWRSWQLAQPPSSLAAGRLEGVRSPAPVNVVLLLDVSGSFTTYLAMRDAALHEVVIWMPKNLRPDDRIAVVDFAANACTLLPSTRVADLSTAAISRSSCTMDSSNTLIQPALDEAARITSGHATSVVVVTDTMVADAQSASVVASVASTGASTMTVITPNGVPVSADWANAFPWESAVQAAPDNSVQTAVAVGQAFAHATDQKLVAH
jgi:hypothetical protein